MPITHLDLLQKLEKSGFSDKEAKVYLAVLEQGGAFPSKIASYAGLNRSTAYAVLLNLSVRGLVNEIEKRGKLFYQIASPEKILRFAKNRVQLAEEGVARVQSILPDIEGLHGILGERPRITYHEGEEGILSIYTDHLSEEKPYEMLAWANAHELRQFLPPKFFDGYVKEKERIGITTRGIVPDTPQNRAFTAWRYQHIAKRIWPEIRFVSAKGFPFIGEITVYGARKVSIANFEKEKMVGTIIEDDAIHRIMRTIFELSWNSKQVRE